MHRNPELLKEPQTARLWHTVRIEPYPPFPSQSSAARQNESVTIQHESLPWVYQGLADVSESRRVVSTDPDYDILFKIAIKEIVIKTSFIYQTHITFSVEVALALFEPPILRGVYSGG
jgi:hypothetical protein